MPARYCLTVIMSEPSSSQRLKPVIIMKYAVAPIRAENTDSQKTTWRSSKRSGGRVGWKDFMTDLSARATDAIRDIEGEVSAGAHREGFSTCRVSVVPAKNNTMFSVLM